MINKKSYKFLIFLCILMILNGCSFTKDISTSQTVTQVAPKSTNVVTEPFKTENKNLIPAKITKVTDGDTMHILINNKKETIRLLLVDTPESVKPGVKVQPFAMEASNFAKEVLTDKDVKIEIDVSERDKYGRLLCYLYIGDKMFNEMLLEKGLARVAYIYPPNVKYVDKFQKIQQKAQKSGIGIWSIENYAQEDGFHPEIIK